MKKTFQFLIITAAYFSACYLVWLIFLSKFDIFVTVELGNGFAIRCNRRV